MFTKINTMKKKMFQLNNVKNIDYTKLRFADNYEYEFEEEEQTRKKSHKKESPKNQ